MAIIKKNLFNNTKQIFPNSTGKIKYWIDATEEQIEIKVYSNESVEGESTDVVILWDIIKLSELQKKPGFVDQTLWSRAVSIDILPAQTVEQNTPYDYKPIELNDSCIIDVFGETLISKPKSLAYSSSSYASSLYNIFVPDSSDFSSCVIRLLFDSKYEAGFEVEGPSAASFIDEHIAVQDLIAPITLSSTQTSVTPNSSISITVNSEPYIDEVYLESVSGILNKTRVKLTNGQGKFSILTTDMEVGEEIRVKAGHRKWSGVASFFKQIS